MVRTGGALSLCLVTVTTTFDRHPAFGPKHFDIAIGFDEANGGVLSR